MTLPETSPPSAAVRDPAYRICSRCIMDTTDPEIVFDADGVCNHCYRYDAMVSSPSYLARREPGALDAFVARVKVDGQGRDYDCVIGISGGVDSSYLAYLTHELGLRPLAVHLDNGWNSELAVANIRNLLERFEIDLYTHVLDWESFRDLQLSFLKASTPDAEIPTDHAILALLYDVAIREGIGHILIGRNTATEGGGVAAWSQGHGDWGYIRGVHKRFGSVPLANYPHFGIRGFVRNTILRRIETTPILDYVDYDKGRAIETLVAEAAWRPYGGKHYESVYTRFFQGYILPTKFGYDKRVEHLAALIWSGQRTRAEALTELEQGREADYPADLQRQDATFVAKKFGMSEDAFQALLDAPPKSFWDYPSYRKWMLRSGPLMAVYKRLRM